MIRRIWARIVRRSAAANVDQTTKLSAAESEAARRYHQSNQWGR